MRSLLTVVIISLSSLVISAKDPVCGYRGFVEWDNSIGKMHYTICADAENHYECTLFTGLTTTHGYQFNSHCFLGGGIAILFSPIPQLMIPVYADFRYDAKFGKFTPYADVKLGYGIPGAYFSPSVGYRFSCGKKANFNIGIGLTLRNAPEDGTDPLGSLKLGFDF